MSSISQAVSDMPDEQPGAIAAEDAKAGHATKATEGLVDIRGDPFDPQIHEVGADGMPRLSARGKLMRRRGRGSASYVAPPRENARGAVAAQENPEARVAGKAMADLVILLGVVLGGEEWVPTDWKPALGDGGEAAALEQAYTRWCENAGIDEVPPWAAALFVTGAYVVPKLFMPKTKSRMAKGKTWIKSKYMRWRMKRAGLDPDTVNDTRSDSGNDGKRKDDTGKETG